MERSWLYNLSRQIRYLQRILENRVFFYTNSSVMQPKRKLILDPPLSYHCGLLNAWPYLIVDMHEHLELKDEKRGMLYKHQGWLEMPKRKSIIYNRERKRTRIHRFQITLVGYVDLLDFTSHDFLLNKWAFFYLCK